MKNRLCVVIASLFIACGDEPDAQLAPPVDNLTSELLTPHTSCSVDPNHWITATPELSGSTVTGYWITYHATKDGWHLGDSNHEHVSVNNSHWWDSADNGVPEEKKYRKMPDHLRGGITVEAVFDKDGIDPSCTVGF